MIMLTVVINCFSQDIITKKNAEDIKAKVLEVTTTDVSFKKFESPNGPTYRVLKSEILMIRYQDGSKDVFSEAQAPVEKPTTEDLETIDQQDYNPNYNKVNAGAAWAEAKRQREQLRLEHKEQQEKKRELKRLIVGSDKYKKCKRSKNLWLSSALITGAAGTFSYLQANKYMKDYPTATTEAASIAQKADMYNSIYPVCFAVAGLCTIEFLFKTIKISKARTHPVSFYPIPIKDGAGLSLSFKF